MHVCLPKAGASARTSGTSWPAVRRTTPSEAPSRISAAASRISSGHSPVSAYPSRISADKSRISADPSRISLSKSRISADPSKISADKSRISSIPSKAPLPSGRPGANHRYMKSAISKGACFPTSSPSLLERGPGGEVDAEGDYTVTYGRLLNCCYAALAGAPCWRASVTRCRLGSSLWLGGERLATGLANGP